MWRRGAISKTFVACLTASLASVLTVTGVLVYRFGSLSDGMAYAAGNRLTISEPVPRMTEDRRSRRFAFTIRNMTGRRVKVVGAAVSCSCMATDELPVEIPAEGSRVLEVVVRLRADQKKIDEKVVFYTDDKQLPKLTGRISVSLDE